MRSKAPAKSLRLTAANPPVESDSDAGVRIESFCSSATVRPEKEALPVLSQSGVSSRSASAEFSALIDRVQGDVGPHQRADRPAHCRA